MTRIREVLVAQKIALAEQQNQERRYKATPSEFDDDAASYQDKMEGAGGFAGPDSKKRRGVGFFWAFQFSTLTICRELLLLAVATAATEQRRQNGDVVLMVLERCVMLVACVCIPWTYGATQANCSTDYAKLTRKMGSKGSSSNSNIRPKEMTASSPQ